jgi:predicted SAM-dependent methyltransferase
LEQKTLKLHLGCGTVYKEGYINVDYYDDSVRDLKADSKSLPFENNTVDLIEAHHLIEHYAYPEHKEVLNEWWRVLKPGGKLIMECPNIDVCMQLFLSNYGGQRWSYWRATIYGLQTHPGQFHKSGINPEYMHALLTICEFQNINFEPAIPSWGIDCNMRVVCTKGKKPAD